jgi:hypothetical protein
VSWSKVISIMRLNTRRRVLGFLGIWLTVISTMSAAQMTASHAPPNTPNSKHIEGAVARIDGNEILLRVKGGTTETYQLSPTVQIRLSRPASMTDLTSGGTVGCTSVYNDGAKVLASECHIFPDGMRGVAAGSSPTPASSTPTVEGTVTEVSEAAGVDEGEGRHILIRIADQGGTTTTMTISSLTEITIIRPGDASALKVGATVRGISQQAADGTGVIQVLTIMSGGPGKHD